MKPLFYLLVSILTLNSLQAQRYLTQKGLNRVMNRAFGSLVTGQQNSTQIANYASFDPANGAFTFKGVIPVGNEDSGRLSYLSLRLGGDLISDSYAALFINSSLNTNSFIQAEWNVHLLGKEPISYLRSDRVELTIKKGLLTSDRDAKFNQIDRDLALNNENLQISTNRRTGLQYDRTNKLNQHAAILARITTISGSSINLDTLKKYTDSLSNNRKSISAIESGIMASTRQVDSINLVIANYSAYRTVLRRRVEADYNSKLSKLEDSASLTSLTLNWFTFMASTGRKKYFRFDDTQPYWQQITKEELNTYRLGIIWNFYKQSFFRKRALYLNLGFARVKDNNTIQLSAQEVVQVRTLKNSVGDTVRTVTKKYNAYSDPIITLKSGVCLQMYITCLEQEQQACTSFRK